MRTLRDGYLPGDLGFDPLGLKPKDEAGFRAMQNKELNSARRAFSLNNARSKYAAV